MAKSFIRARFVMGFAGRVVGFGVTGGSLLKLVPLSSTSFLLTPSRIFLFLFTLFFRSLRPISFFRFLGHHAFELTPQCFNSAKLIAHLNQPKSVGPTDR